MLEHSNSMTARKVIFITGASSGIGKACFDHLTAMGHNVYGTSRKKSKTPNMLGLDVTNADNCTEAVRFVLEKEGKIDVLINNAGISSIGSIEETPNHIARSLIETNFWGVLNMCHAILPQMRQQGFGHIITIGSIAGLLAVPYQAHYSASKFALEGYMEGLSMEVKQFGIQVCLIEPGDFLTSISDNRAIIQPSDNSPYKTSFNRAYDVIFNGEQNGAKPLRIAKLVEKIIHRKHVKVRYPVGKFMDVISVPLKKILPQRLFEWLILNHYGL